MKSYERGFIAMFCIIAIILSTFALGTVSVSASTTAEAAVSGFSSDYNISAKYTVSINDSYVGSGTVTGGAGSVSVTSNSGLDSSGCGNDYYSATTEIKIYNNYPSSYILLSFDYLASNNGTMAMGGVLKEETQSSVVDAVVAPSDSYLISFASSDENTDDSTLSITNISVVVINPSTVTVKGDDQCAVKTFKDQSSSTAFPASTEDEAAAGITVYTLNGSTDSHEFTDVAYTQDYIHLTATLNDPDNYQFLGFADQNGNTVGAAYTPKGDTVIAPVVVPASLAADSGAAFKVGEYYTNDLNAAASVAASNTQGTKVITQIANYTLAAGEYVIKPGVTLNIPRKADTYTAQTKPDITSNDAAKEAVALSAFRTLTMSDGAHITIANGGFISIAGQLNNAHTSAYDGLTSDTYGCIRMNGASTITVEYGARLFCFGFITGEYVNYDQANGETIAHADNLYSCKIIAKPGSTVMEPMQPRDFRGGNASGQIVNNRSGHYVFPITRYFIQNIQVPLELQKGAVEKLYSCLYNSAYASQPEFLGGTGIFTLGDGGKAIKYYDPNVDRTHVDIEGQSSLGQMLMYVGTNSLNSGDYVLPINNIIVTIKDGATLTTNKRIEFLPGSSVIIEEGGTVDIGTGGAIYVVDSDDFADKYFYPTSGANAGANRTGASPYKEQAANMHEDAYIKVNGTLHIGNIFATTMSGGAITCDDGVAGVVTLKNTDAGSLFGFAQSGNGGSFEQITTRAAILKNSNGTYRDSIARKAMEATFTYTPYHNAKGEDIYVWKSDVDPEYYNVKWVDYNGDDIASLPAQQVYDLSDIENNATDDKVEVKTFYSSGAEATGTKSLVDTDEMYYKYKFDGTWSSSFDMDTDTMTYAPSYSELERHDIYFKYNNTSVSAANAHCYHNETDVNTAAIKYFKSSVDAMNAYALEHVDTDQYTYTYKTAEYTKQVISGTGQKYTINANGVSNLPIDQDMAFAVTYTQTERNYNVTWYDDDGDELQNKNVLYSKVAENAPADPYHNGAVFTGWSAPVYDVSTLTATVTANYKVYFEKHSLTVKDNFDVNFLVKLHDDDPDDLHVDFTWGKTWAATDEEYLYDETAQTASSGLTASGSYYKATLSVNAKEINDTITAKLKNSEGTVIATETYKVSDYLYGAINTDDGVLALTLYQQSDQPGAESIPAEDEQTYLDKADNLKALCKAALAYGAAAQVEFNYLDSGRADADLAESEQYEQVYTANLDACTNAVAKYDCETTGNGFLAYKGMFTSDWLNEYLYTNYSHSYYAHTLRLNSSLGFTMCLRAYDDAPPINLQRIKAYSSQWGANNETVYLTVENTGRELVGSGFHNDYYTVTGIPIARAFDDIMVNIDNNERYFVINAGAYVDDVLKLEANSQNDANVNNMSNTVVNLYNYSMAAKAFFQ